MYALWDELIILIKGLNFSWACMIVYLMGFNLSGIIVG